MQVFSSVGQLDKCRRPLKDIVAVIGVFDGVHLGHQEVIGRAVRDARRIGGTSLVITFHPHPVQVLFPERFSSYISTLKQRLEHIASLGVDACLVVPFTRRFAALGPVDFVERYLVKKLHVREIVVGNDFHFGHDRIGTIRLLDQQGKKFGFKIRAAHLKKRNNIYIKSSYIKKLILAGEIDKVSGLMGRRYAFRGRVVRGDARGRTMGYPTANIKKENVVIPPFGIYVAYVLLRGKRHEALFYIGTRPSFKRVKLAVSLEAHVLDFKGDLYGQTLDIELLKWIRPDRKFSDGESLAKQMRDDEKYAREYFTLLRKTKSR